tara:strand:+ start:449 stop:643 length:195 start_codon:yes stop_codon:yes gene_type:complete
MKTPSFDPSAPNPLVEFNYITTPIKMYEKVGIRCGGASGFFFKHNKTRYLITNRHAELLEEIIN